MKRKIEVGITREYDYYQVILPVKLKYPKDYKRHIFKSDYYFNSELTRAEIEGVKSRADVFIMLDFPPTPRSTKKYPTKRDVVRYLENLGLTYSEKDAIILEGEMDRVLGSILRNSQYTKWAVFDYEVSVDQSMILRKAGRVERGQYHEFVRRLFHEGGD